MGKRIIISDEKLFELREQRLSYQEITNYFNENGIKIDKQTIRKKCKELYARLGKEEPMAISKLVRKSKANDEKIYALRKKGFTYGAIAESITTDENVVTKSSVQRRSKIIFQEKGEEDLANLLIFRSPRKKEITDEEIYMLRKQSLSYEDISKHFEKQGKIISLFGVRKRCKRIFQEKGEQEPTAIFVRRGHKKIDIDPEEIYAFRAEGWSFKKITRYYKEQGKKICSTTVKRLYRELLEQKGEVELTIASIPIEEVIKLRNEGLSFEKIAKYYNEKGIRVSDQTIRSIYINAIRQNNAENEVNSGESLKDLERELEECIENKKKSSELLHEYEKLEKETKLQKGEEK